MITYNIGLAVLITYCIALVFDPEDSGWKHTTAPFAIVVSIFMSIWVGYNILMVSLFDSDLD